MKIDTSNLNTNFRAKLISEWSCKNQVNSVEKINIVRFEKNDLRFLSTFFDRFELNNIDYQKFSILKSAISTIINILKFENQELLKKTKIWGAVYKDKLCGLLVANIPKRDSKSNKIIYSSRHNPARKETEIDWLVTWNPTGDKSIKGIGKSLVGEYYGTLAKDGFRDVYVRSEIPEYSFALSFYEGLGFEKLSEKRTRLSTKMTSKCIIDDGSNDYDLIIPAIVTKRNIKIAIQELNKRMKPKKLDGREIELK